MMLTGRNIRPDKAKKMKLVDVAVDPIGKLLLVRNLLKSVGFAITKTETFVAP